MIALPGSGLRITFVHRHSPALALAVGLAFGIYMALADATIFSAAIPEAQRINVAETPALIRFLAFAWRVTIDEIVLRLIAMSALVALFTKLAGERRAACYWLAIILVAGIAFPLRDHAYFASLGWSPLTLGRELALHVSASALWGWLYWRHGFLAAVTGHIAAHLALQPLLGLLT